jgi:hypothetical protein
MARKGTAADIIRLAIIAKNFDLEMRNNIPTKERKASYLKFQRGQISLRSLISAQGAENPEFVEVFGDSRRIPSYERFRKLVRIAKHSRLTNPETWDKLPDSVEAIFELSFLPPKRLEECILSERITKEETLETVMNVSTAERESIAQVKAILAEEKLAMLFPNEPRAEHPPLTDKQRKELELEVEEDFYRQSKRRRRSVIRVKHSVVS